MAFAILIKKVIGDHMFTPPGCIDTLYDYIPLLSEEGLCQIPEESSGKKVAIIGSGPAGIVAAHELLKIGIIPVIYEAHDRMGGRLYSRKFEQVQDNIQPFAEMGAMRIPLSSRIFYHYVNKLGLSYHLKFPSPGHVNTSIYFQNKLYNWGYLKKLPEPFHSIDSPWKLFIEPFVKQIHTEWRRGNLDTVRQLWQMNIDQYKNMSLYQALIERSPVNTTDYIKIFGALGVGHGGFSPLFQISFLEILRLFANDYLEHNYFITEGISEFVNRLYHLRVKTPYGVRSLSDINCLHLNLPVVNFDYNNETNNPVIVTKDNNNVLNKIEYDAVIFTGSLCAAHLLNISNKTSSGVYLMTASVREAIKNSPMVASSKTYICTENKFWVNTRLPQCILTDDITRSTYFLDYPNTKRGVVCLSYTWGMDAMKLHAVDPKDRVTIFKRSLCSIYPDLSKYLIPLNGEVLNVDWINVKYQNGAFKIFTPGNDERQRNLYFQFQSVLTKEDKGIYLAGDSISWSGGWVEGAMCTSLNAVFAVAKRFGGKIAYKSPLSQDKNLFHY